MKLSGYFFVMVLIGSMLFLPAFQGPQEVTVFNLRPKSIQFNVQGTQVEFESNVPVAIDLEISIYNHDTDTLEPVTTVTMFGSYVLNVVERGYYVFTFLSIQIATITIDVQGIPTSSYLIFGSLVSIMLVTAISNRYIRTPAY